MKKYLSDVIDIDNLIKAGENKLFIIAGVGAGKSTWVSDILAKKGNVLFVTSRKAKVLEDINCTCFSDVFKWYTNDNQTLVTNAKISYMVEKMMSQSQNDLDEFLSYFDYIVIDEVHSIATDSTFAESSFGLLAFIEYAVTQNKTIIAMTGTPEPIQDYFDNHNWKTLDYRNKCKYVHPEKIFLRSAYSIISDIQRELNASKKIIYFANHTDTIISMCEKLLKTNDVTPADISIIVSKNKEAEFNKKLKQSFDNKIYETIIDNNRVTYENIIENNLLPENCKILFSTSTLREGVNIKNNNLAMVCENHILSNLIQFFGRARNSKSNVYIIEDSSDHTIQNDALLYQYACEKESDAANQFFKDKIKNSENLLVEEDKKKLIHHVTKNPYIYFNCIKNQFEPFHIKYNEELRLLESKANWITELISYCSKYNIFCSYCNWKDIVPEVLIRMAEKETKFFDDKEKDLILRLLKYAFKINDKQPNKINTKLKEHNQTVEILPKKETKGEYRGKTYWQIIYSDNKKEN